VLATAGQWNSFIYSRRIRENPTLATRIQQCPFLGLFHDTLASRLPPRHEQNTHSSFYLHIPHILVGDTNNTASGTASSVTGLLRFLVATLAKVVSTGVDDNGAANDALGTDQLDQLVGNASLSITLGISLEVAQVTDVALLVARGTVSLVVGVEVRTGRCAAVCVVTEGVDVHATLSVGIVAGDVP
jgi:hypothetical protein